MKMIYRIKSRYIKLCPCIGIGYWKDVYRKEDIGMSGVAHNIILPFFRIQWGYIEYEKEDWNDSKQVLPVIGQRILVEFPNGNIYDATCFEDNGFDVYLRQGEENASKDGIYPFSRSTCVRWKPKNKPE